MNQQATIESKKLLTLLHILAEIPERERETLLEQLKDPALYGPAVQS